MWTLVKSYFDLLKVYFTTDFFYFGWLIFFLVMIFYLIKRFINL